jgi:hypothetical protein
MDIKVSMEEPYIPEESDTPSEYSEYDDDDDLGDVVF